MTRPIRNPTQVRSILANLALSIEESRARRMGSPVAKMTPTPEAEPASAPAASAFAPPPPQRATVPTATTPRSIASSLNTNAGPGPMPPIRTSSEMFDGGAPRLKAQPKRPS